MVILYGAALLLAAYLLGSIPSGLLIVRLTTGKDVRTIESGRTGGTNVARAAGMWAGVFTAIFDGLKAAISVWLSQWLFPQVMWLHILAPIAAILGHNYSIFMIEKDANGKIRLRGGAGGASCVGGSLGLWAPSILIIIPVGAAILFLLGYASVATLSAALVSTLIFAYRAWMGASPWEYTIYGILAFFLLAWALRPNIKRLILGTERIVGLRARRHKADGQETDDSKRDSLSSVNSNH